MRLSWVWTPKRSYCALPFVLDHHSRSLVQNINYDGMENIKLVRLQCRSFLSGGMILALTVTF